MVRILLLFFSLLVPLHSFGGDCTTDILNALFSSESKAWSGSFEVKHLKLEGISSVPLGPGKPPTYVSIFYKGEFAGRIRFNVNQTTLKFDIRLEEKFQGSKLYSYLMEQVVKKNPQVRHIPSSMNWNNSENARIFVRNLAENKVDLEKILKSDYLKELSRKELVELRTQVINSLQTMPALKARRSNGFSDIEKIVLHKQTPVEISFLVNQGELKVENTKFILQVDQATYLDLNSSGILSTVSQREASIPEYEAMLIYPNGPSWPELPKRP